METYTFLKGKQDNKWYSLKKFDFSNRKNKVRWREYIFSKPLNLSRSNSKKKTLINANILISISLIIPYLLHSIPIFRHGKTSLEGRSSQSGCGLKWVILSRLKTGSSKSGIKKITWICHLESLATNYLM